LKAFYNDIKVQDAMVSELASSIRTINKLSLPVSSPIIQLFPDYLDYSREKSLLKQFGVKLEQ